MVFFQNATLRINHATNSRPGNIAVTHSLHFWRHLVISGKNLREIPSNACVIDIAKFSGQHFFFQKRTPKDLGLTKAFKMSNLLCLVKWDLSLHRKNVWLHYIHLQNTARICVYVNGPTFLGATFHRNSNTQTGKIQVTTVGFWQWHLQKVATVIIIEKQL